MNWELKSLKVEKIDHIYEYRRLKCPFLYNIKERIDISDEEQILKKENLVSNILVGNENSCVSTMMSEGKNLVLTQNCRNYEHKLLEFSILMNIGLYRMYKIYLQSVSDENTKELIKIKMNKIVNIYSNIDNTVISENNVELQSMESKSEIFNNALDSLIYLRSTNNNRTQLPRVESMYPALEVPFLNFIQNITHSSVLRITIQPVILWCHYDTLDNFLLPIDGKRKVTLIPPIYGPNIIDILEGPWSKVAHIRVISMTEEENIENSIITHIMKQDPTIIYDLFYKYVSSDPISFLTENNYWKELTTMLVAESNEYHSIEDLIIKRLKFSKRCDPLLTINEFPISGFSSNICNLLEYNESQNLLDIFNINDSIRFIKLLPMFILLLLFKNDEQFKYDLNFFFTQLNIENNDIISFLTNSSIDLTEIESKFNSYIFNEIDKKTETLENNYRNDSDEIMKFILSSKEILNIILEREEFLHYFLASSSEIWALLENMKYILYIKIKQIILLNKVNFTIHSKTVTLNSNQALYIPRYWWHIVYVPTEGISVAVNAFLDDNSKRKNIFGNSQPVWRDNFIRSIGKTLDSDEFKLDTDFGVSALMIDIKRELKKRNYPYYKNVDM